MALDYKKSEPKHYKPTETPTILTVPTMKFFAYSGQGNPNTSQEWQDAISALYKASYAIRAIMTDKHVVCPLEAYWTCK